MLRERTELLIGFNVAEVFPEFSSVSSGLLSEEQADKLFPSMTARSSSRYPA